MTQFTFFFGYWVGSGVGGHEWLGGGTDHQRECCTLQPEQHSRVGLVIPRLVPFNICDATNCEVESKCSSF